MPRVVTLLLAPALALAAAGCASLEPFTAPEVGRRLAARIRCPR